MRWLGPLWVLAGCGRFGFESEANHDANHDANPDATPCMLGPFGPTRPLLELNGAGNDAHPMLSPDRLTIWFDSSRSGSNQIWTAERPQITAPFGPPRLVTVGMTGDNGDPFVSDDGLSLWFDNAPGSQADLYVATRARTDVDFSNPQELTGFNSSADDFAPTVTSDELLLVFNSYRGSDDDLYLSTRATRADAWSAPIRIDGVRTSGVECCGSLSANGDTLVFASARTTPGYEKLYQATRDATGFSNPIAIEAAAVGSDGTDTHPNLSRDRKSIVFTSDRSGGAGGLDMYEIDRECVGN